MRTVLEGSVRRAGNRIRVTAQLISAEDGSHLWSERYDREMADVFALQDEIAAAIAAALRVKLSVEGAAPRQYAPNLPAYEALLRARHHLYKLTLESMARARECLEQAIALDPGYALPHTELGFYFAFQAVFGMRPAHAQQGKLEEAVTAAEKEHSLAPWRMPTIGRFAGLLRRTGDSSSSSRILPSSPGRIKPTARA